MSKLGQSARRGPPCHLGLIDFLDAVARMREPESKITVIGDDEQALCICIQASRRIETGTKISQLIQDSLSSPLIPSRGQWAFELVEKDMQPRLYLQRPAVQFNPLNRRINLSGGIGDYLSVNADPASADQCGRLAARGRAGEGDEL